MQWLRCLAEDAEILKVEQPAVAVNDGDSDDQPGNVNNPSLGGPNGKSAPASGQLSSRPSDMQQSPNSPTQGAQDAEMVAPANDGAVAEPISRLDDVDDLMVDSSQPASNPLSPTKDIMNGIENTHLKT
ncbi:hypothetical protein H4R34_005244 [Dimargaris verticillata]|uniref:Uncharacterized protein n=1 Tax=Dimargaris verticillata TaxID=2761393 RepID=A0A9W8AYK6_9FUNG|nr:hypothetical protein H4R34_005244 [Dimargaris verticillata]